MKILLTGATGFVGSAFLRRALARGHTVASLIAPDRNAGTIIAAASNHVWLRGTLADAPWKEIEKFQPDTCVHTAWITTPGVYLESPLNDDLLKWSTDLFSRFYSCGGSHAVGVGTCIEYQMGARRLNELRTPTGPTTRYARAKDQLRIALEKIAPEQGATACWARLFYPYGPGEHPARLASHLIQKLRRLEWPTLATPNSVKDYIYIDDVASALLTLLEARATGIYNIGSGMETSVQQIAELVAKIVGARCTPAAASAVTPPPADFVVADVTRLQALGWLPQVTLEVGLQRLADAIAQPQQV